MFLKIKFFLVFPLLFLFFTSSNALANTSKCELDLDSFSKYKSNLIKCLDNENLKINEKISKKIDKLSIEKSNYLSNDFLKNEKFIIKDKLIINDKFNNYLSSTIKKNSQDIYGIHNELNNLRLQNTISDQGYDKLVDQSLGDFVNSIYNPNQSLNKINVLSSSNVAVVTKAIGVALVATVLTNDEDEPSKLNFSLSSSSAAENGGTTITLTATAEDNVNSDTKVNFTLSGDATSGTDYSVAATFVTISSGSKTASTTFTITDDSVYEGNETITFTSSTITGDDGYINESAAISFTITENESAPVITMNFNNCSSFTAISTTVAENASGTHCITTFTSQIADEDITVNVSLGGTAGTSDYSSDYLSRGYITIDANSTQSSFSFDPSTDSINEQNETLIVSISSVSGADATESGTQSETITITDTTTDSTVSFAASASSIDENSSSSITITATLSAATYEDVSISLSTSGTSTEGTDYGTISDITVSAGSTTGTVSFTPTDDTTYEGNETAIIDISGVSGGGASESGTQQLTLTITENESAPTVSISANSTTIAEKSGSSITITATSTGASDEDITVSIATSGTSTEGTDYGTISDITISALSTTGTASLTPTADTSHEVSETAIIDISVSGGGASENGAQQITINITDKALDSGTQKTYSSSLTSTIGSSTEYTNIEFFNSGKASEDSPYETINLAEALGYNDYGAGQEIAIVDSGYTASGCNNGALHDEFSGKTTASYGTITCAGFTSGTYHGTSVASIAAGVKDGAGIMGVASGANLRVSDYSNISGAASQANHWANLTDNAAGNSIVQNNSWGYDDSQTLNAAQNAYHSNSHWAINDYVSYMNSNSLSASQTLAAHASLDNDNNGANDIGYSNTATQWDAYVTSLNTFQNDGVIVFALSNNSNYDDADVSAALPELYPQLKEAWITTANVDKTGSSGGYTYTLQSAPCGSTAEYCLSGDGTNITVAANANNTDTDLYSNATGTSFVAPQVSGAIAILANHFPNHTPEKLVDRLLASAENDWATFGVDGTVTFGNGVVHGYSTDYGHGMMDIYAALQPITTDALGRSLYTSKSNTSDLSKAQSLERTYLATSRSFGDAISNAVDGKLISNFYDAMGSQFAYNVGDHIVVPESNTAPAIKIENEMNRLTSAYSLNKQLNLNNSEYKSVIKQKIINDDNNLKSIFAMTLGSSAIPTQSFFNFDQYAFNGITDYNLPFLNKNDQGLSLNSMIEFDKFKFSLSTTTPMKQNASEYLGEQKSILSSLEYQFNDSLSFGLLNGIVNERENFLGLQGGEALSVNNSSNISKFNSVKLQKNIFDDLSLTFTGSYAISSFDGDASSMIGSAKNIRSDSYSININKANLFKNDNFAFSISQPNRVNSGELVFRLSDLADYDGNIEITEVPVSLKPSGRQIDTTVSYAYDFEKDITLTSKITYTNELNHTKGNNDVVSSFIGLKRNNLKLGLSETNSFKETNFMIDFKKSF